MAVVETTDKSKIDQLLSADPIAFLEPLDESKHGMEGLVSVFHEDVEAPRNMLIVRWGQKNLGLGSLAHLVSSRLSELPELLDAFPKDRGQMELRFPFWASGAIGSKLKTADMSAEARYVLEQGALVPTNVVKHTERLDDPRVVKPMFPKLADDAPIHVLALEGQLVAVAAVTHLLKDVAAIHVYTTEASRGRGFGRGVLTALAEELLAMEIVPTVTVDLGQEAAVRMVERAGFHQHATYLKTTVLGPAEAARGLVTL